MAEPAVSIPGYVATPTMARFRSVVAKVGVSIIGQTADLAPADKRLYGVRDVSATVESIPLITASILSKKLAAGLDALAMDVKFGNGAFMSTVPSARALAQSITSVAAGAGMPTTPLPAWLLTQARYSLKLRAGLPPDTAKAFTKVASPATGTKSVAGSYPG